MPALKQQRNIAEPANLYFQCAAALLSLSRFIDRQTYRKPYLVFYKPTAYG